MWKNVIFTSLSLNQTLTHLPLHPTTIDDYHKPLSLTVEPPHEKEHFNQSEIL